MSARSCCAVCRGRVEKHPHGGERTPICVLPDCTCHPHAVTPGMGRRKRKATSPRPFCIEYSFLPGDKWRVWRRYAAEAVRDEALARYQRSNLATCFRKGADHA